MPCITVLDIILTFLSTCSNQYLWPDVICSTSTFNHSSSCSQSLSSEPEHNTVKEPGSLISLMLNILVYVSVITTYIFENYQPTDC